MSNLVKKLTPLEYEKVQKNELYFGPIREVLIIPDLIENFSEKRYLVTRREPFLIGGNFYDLVVRTADLPYSGDKFYSIGLVNNHVRTGLANDLFNRFLNTGMNRFALNLETIEELYLLNIDVSKLLTDNEINLFYSKPLVLDWKKLESNELGQGLLHSVEEIIDEFN